ncbi:MAG: CerR family C-terminal domain-containing protein [Phycisphaerales bacterium]|nr:MAG: CerR family C-terminal domain-containing protein [Phycisphaerales bacterium]
MARRAPQRTSGPRASSRRDALETQARLLDAAGRLFAAKGFQETSVREICSAAEANVAAVRHHFGSKGGLYRTIVLRSHQGLLEHDPLPRFRDGDDPAAALGRAIEHLLRVTLVRRTGHPYAGQLFAHELRSPTAALDELLEKFLKPLRAEFARIVAALLQDADSPRLRGHCTTFVIGLCVFHELGKEPLKRFGFPPPQRESDVPRLARLVTQFAHAGILSLRQTT